MIRNHEIARNLLVVGYQTHILVFVRNPVGQCLAFMGMDQELGGSLRCRDENGECEREPQVHCARQVLFHGIKILFHGVDSQGCFRHCFSK